MVRTANPPAPVDENRSCFSKCFAGDDDGSRPPVAPTSAEARSAFVAAIKEYNWAAAERLAATEQDREDIKDSRARVEHMEFNMVGSWVGDETPAFIEPFDPLDEELLSEPARRPKINQRDLRHLIMAL